MLSRRTSPKDWPQIRALLQAANLPLDGAQEHLETFRLVERAGHVCGVAGLEIHGEAALLRSVATGAEYRS